MARRRRTLLASPDRLPRGGLLRARRRRALEALWPLHGHVLHRRRRLRRAPYFRVRRSLRPGLVLPRRRAALAAHARGTRRLGPCCGCASALSTTATAAMSPPKPSPCIGATCRFVRFECGPSVSCLFE